MGTHSTHYQNGASRLRLQPSTKRSLPQICARRFNAAIDRTSLADAVVDHLIAAEALFLKDAGKPEDRSELGFRLALRAALLLGEDAQDRVTIYRCMKRAYHVRSAVAHGGSLPTEVKGVFPDGWGAGVVVGTGGIHH